MTAAEEVVTIATLLLARTDLDARVFRQRRRGCGVVGTNLDARVFRQRRRVCCVVDTNLDARVSRQWHRVVAPLAPILMPELFVNGTVFRTNQVVRFYACG